MRLIDADALDFAFPMPDDFNSIMKQMGIEMAKARVMNAPTIEATPVVHGEWSAIEDDYAGLIALQCSECNQEYWFEDDPPLKIYSYCPNCGAKMDRKVER